MRLGLKRSAMLVVTAFCSAILFSFQNCAPVKFEGVEQASKVVNQSIPGSAVVTAGDTDTFPPLKLVFVVDNSGTMQINQINLSSAFGKMFEGSNASNLTPFESTAYLFNTSQKSIDKNNALFAKVPSISPFELNGRTYADLMGMRGTTTTQGLLAGDLAGYAAKLEDKAGLKTVNYIPAPVVGIKQAGSLATVSLGVSKTQDGSVADFAKEFRDRIAILDPARSAIDSGTLSGILDPIVDKESGLCALARVMKNNENFVPKGSVAAFVVVSDENDADPSGSACIDQVADYQSTEDYIDGRCEQDRTVLSYRPLNTNPASASCNVSYNVGFNYSYTYSIPTTIVTYYTKARSYERPQSTVTYRNYMNQQTIPQTLVKYFTFSYTYELKQTEVTYFKQTAPCPMRDGVCTGPATYQSYKTNLEGDFADNCSTFVSGRLPSGALYSESGYLPSCKTAAPLAKSGTCPNSPNVQNCVKVYSSAANETATLAGVLGSQTCVQFATGKLPSNAVYNDAGKTPTCVDATQVLAVTEGKCPSSTNCVDSFSAPKTAVITGAKQFCDTNVVGKLGANAVYNNDGGYKPTCVAATSKKITQESGECPATLDPNAMVTCVNAPKGPLTKTLEYAPTAGQTCEAFGKLPSDAYLGNASYPVSCASGTPVNKSTTGSISYANLSLTSDPALSSCSDAIVTKVKSDKNLTAYDKVSCTVTSYNKGATSYSGMCSTASTNAVCNVATKKGCTDSQVAAGDQYLAEVSELWSGAFDCNTACSATSFCAAKPGTVGQNYYACRVTAAPPEVKKVFTQELASNTAVCPTGQNLVKTKGPYKTSGTKTRYVAGTLSESGDPAALSKYIRNRSQEIFGEELPSVSVFVRQPGDSLGTNGSLGTAYNEFADAMGGQKRSVLSNADGYATALVDLGTMVREKLNRSLFAKEVGSGQKIIRVYHRKQGTTDWGSPLPKTEWSASGGTVTLSSGFDFEYGDEFKIDFQ